MTFADDLHAVRFAALAAVFVQMPDAELVSIAVDGGTVLLDAAVDRAGRPVYPGGIDWAPVEECFGHNLAALAQFHVRDLHGAPGYTEAVLRANTIAMWGGGTPYVLRRPA